MHRQPFEGLQHLWIKTHFDGYRFVDGYFRTIVKLLNSMIDVDEDDLISTVTFDDRTELESPNVDHSTVSGFEPNAAARRLLAQSWKTLSGEQQLQIRSYRAKRGIKCIVCGAVGYFRENCPNQCLTPPSTPESWESTPPSTPPQSPPNTPPPPSFGLYWGASNDKSHDKSNEVKKKSSYDYRKSVDVGIVRPQAQRVQEKLRSNDEKIGSFQFFTLADDGYCATFSQLSLHQLMRRLMRLIEKQLLKNAAKLEASFDTTLLHPPSERHLGPTFYPEELLKVPEYRDQLLSMDKKKDTRRKHQNQASLRPVDELDPLFRGGGAIKFNDDFLYTTNPKAGASIHSKNTWKSVLAKNDGLASSDPTMARKQLEIDKLFEHQSKWIAMQKTDMAYTNDRYEHVVSIIRNELKKEHAREARLLDVDKYTKKTTQMKVYQEQLESVDTIMRCLHCYNLTTAIDQADFLLFTLERWKEILQSKLRAASSSSSSFKTSRHEDSVSDTADESGGEATAPSSRLGRSSSSKSNRALVDNKSSTANKSSKKKGSKGGNHNNSMVASADPYANDKEFLEELNKKLDRRRIRAQRPPKFAPKAVHKALDLDDLMDNRASSVDIAADVRTSSTRGILFSSGSEIGSSRSVTRGSTSSSSAVLGLSMTNADEVDEQREGRGSTARLTTSRITTAKVLSKQLTQAPVLAASDILTSIGESKAYSDNFNDSVAREEKVKKLMQGSKKLRNFVVKPRIHPRQLDDMKMNEAKRAFR